MSKDQYFFPSYKIEWNKMFLPFNGFIASGATDMFLAGSTRVLEVTFYPVGVHSWSNGNSLG